MSRNHSVKNIVSPAPLPMSRLSAQRRRGFATILVMVAVAMAVVLTMSFVNAQATSTAISRNLSNEAQARLIAETAMGLVIAEVNNNDNWRTTHTEGNWINALSIHGGTATVTVTDGIDTNNDGVIDGDHSLSNNLTDSITITAKGTYQGVTHSITTAMLFTLTSDTSVAMVVPDSANLTAQDTARKNQLQNWGYIVNLVDAGAAQAVYDAAATANSIFYVTAPCASASVSTKINAKTCGIVCEQGLLAGTMLMSSAAGTTATGTSVNITNNSHYITNTLTTGSKTIATSAQPIWTYGGTLGTGVTSLTAGPSLITIDRGAKLSGGTSSPGQRVFLPWGGAMDFTQLNATGLTILQRSIDWAGTPAVSAIVGVNTIMSTATRSLSGKQVAFQVTVGSTQTVTSLTAYVKGAASKNLRFAIYADSGGNPGALLCQSAVVTFGTGTAHWHTIAVPSTVLNAGNYWFAIGYDSTNSYYYKDSSASAKERIRTNNAITSGFINPWGASSSSPTGQISIYTGTGATSSPTPPVFGFSNSVRWMEQP